MIKPLRLHLLLVLSFSLTGAVSAQHPAAAPGTPLFGGGMAAHAGIISTALNKVPLAGLLHGLGGRLHLYVAPGLRLGSAGASLRHTYNDSAGLASRLTLSYGGLSVEGYLSRGRWRCAGGVLLGGGSLHHLHITSRTGNTVSAKLYRTSTLIVSPQACVEYALSSAIAAMCSIEYLAGPGLGSRSGLGGPKLQLGVLFNKGHGSR